MKNVEGNIKSVIEQQLNEMAKGKSKNKFDFLQLIFSNSELMSYEPVMLRDLILANYEVKPEHLIYKSMWRWLSKYRKKNDPNFSTAKERLAMHTTTNDKQADLNEDEEDIYIYKNGFRFIDETKQKKRDSSEDYIRQVT